MKSTAKVLMKWLLEKSYNDYAKAHAQYLYFTKRYKATSIRRALRHKACTSIPQFIKLCKAFDNDR